MNLEIIPYEGTPPFRFGLSEAEVVALLGHPEHRWVDKKLMPGWVDLSYHFPFISLSFNPQGSLAQIGLGTMFDGKLTLNGIDLFHDADALGKLVRMDGNPHEWMGFIMLLNLGVRLGGFHEEVSEGRTVSIFERGRYDAKISKFEPFTL